MQLPSGGPVPYRGAHEERRLFEAVAVEAGVERVEAGVADVVARHDRGARVRRLEDNEPAAQGCDATGCAARCDLAYAHLQHPRTSTEQPRQR